MSHQLYLVEHNSRVNRQDRRKAPIMATPPAGMEWKGRTPAPRRQNMSLGIDRAHDFLEMLQWNYINLQDFLRDKEKKKLAFVAGTFAVFSLFTTVLLSVLATASKDEKALFTLWFIIPFIIFIVGVAIVNVSMIKYIVALKLDTLLAMRQLNCVRQGIHSISYLLFEGEFPKPFEQHMFTQGGREAFRDTLLDVDRGYWHIFGRHEKYALNNKEMRDLYNSWKVYYRSADFFAICALVIFTLMLVLSPFFYVFVANIDLTKNQTLILGMICGATALVVVSLVVRMVIVARKEVVDLLRSDEEFSIEKKRRELLANRAGVIADPFKVRKH